MAKITLDKERELTFNFNAAIKFRQATGKSLMKGEVKLDDLDEEGLLALLWAMLSSDDPSLTIEQLGAMINPAKMEGYVEAIVEALKADPLAKTPGS